MFIAAMSTIAKLWKEPRCPSTDEWIKTHTHTHTHTHTEIYTYTQWNITQPSKRMNASVCYVSKISQSEKDKYHMISLICGV